MANRANIQNAQNRMNRRIIQYYQTLKHMENLDHTTHIILSALHFGNTPEPYIHLNNNHPNDKIFDSMWTQAHEYHDKGIQIWVMLGGAGGAYQELFSSHESYKTYYGLLSDFLNSREDLIVGMDLDIEEPVLMSKVQQLVQDLTRDFPNLQLSMAPCAGELTQGPQTPQKTIQIKPKKDEGYHKEGGDEGNKGNKRGGGKRQSRDEQESITQDEQDEQEKQEDTTPFSHLGFLKTPEGSRISMFNVQMYEGCFNYQTFLDVTKHVPPEFMNAGMISGDVATEDAFNRVLDQLHYMVDQDIGGTFIWEYFDEPENWSTKVFDVLKQYKNSNYKSCSVM
jgi:hypothetical protein